MNLQDTNLDQKPEVKFVSKESFREEIDLLKNNVKFLKSQTFNKRKCIYGISLFVSINIICSGALGFLLYTSQSNCMQEVNNANSKAVKLAQAGLSV